MLNQINQNRRVNKNHLQKLVRNKNKNNQNQRNRQGNKNQRKVETINLKCLQSCQHLQYLRININLYLSDCVHHKSPFIYYC